MNPHPHYGTQTPGKATFKVKLDTNTWNFIHKTSPSLEIAFEIFPDIEAIEVEFIKPSKDSTIAYLSRVPKAWIRMNGEVEVYAPDDDAYGISGYLLEIGEQLSPLPITMMPANSYQALNQQRFSMTITPSACLIADPEDFEDTMIEWHSNPHPPATVLEGFTSHANPGGSKEQRLNAQLSAVCEILSKKFGQKIELEKILGSLSKS